MKLSLRLFSVRRGRREVAQDSKVVKPLASPPGTLVHVGERLSEAFQCDAVSYSASSHRREKMADPLAFLESAGAEETRWLRMTGLHEVEMISQFEKTLSVDALQLEDVLNTTSRPKIEDFDTSVFIIARLLEWNDKTQSIDGQQVSILLLPDDTVLTFLEAPTKILDPVYRRISRKGRRIRRSGGSYLVWAILDALVDNYLRVTERFEARLDEMETALENDAESIEVADLHGAKRDATQLVREIRPMREITNVMSRAETDLVKSEFLPFFLDLNDHALQALESAEDIRESVGGLRDFHMTAMSNQMNEVMKVLTCMGAIFLPLTFFAGIYGMNFEHMPELNQPWAYPTLWAFFIVAAGLMFWYFRRKKWL